MLIKLTRQVVVGTRQMLTVTSAGTVHIDANPTREFLLVYNPGSQTVYFAFGENADDTHYPLPPGAYLHDILGGLMPIDEIRFYAASDQTLYYTEA